MASLPPASNLDAILLVSKSRSLGPRLVFHYPPLSPSAAALAAAKDPAWFRNETATATASVASQSSDSDWGSSTENEDDGDIDIGSRTSGGRTSGRTGASFREREKSRLGVAGWGRQDTIDEDDDEDGEDGSGGGGSGSGGQRGGDHDWGTVLGFKVDALEKMLSPGREYNKRRFELAVESIVFVGAPMFVRDDGLWRKRRKKTHHPPVEHGHDDDDHDDDDDDDNDGHDQETEPLVYPAGFEPGYGHDLDVAAAPSEASDAHSNSTTHDSTPDMTMFNVVFVLHPPALEYQQRVKEMYDHVTRKYAKALKYEQARFDYVWREAKRILDFKQRAKDANEPLTATWRNIVAMSPLAKSIAVLFDAIANDKIAHVHFDATFNTSFQIPQPDSTPYLPTALEPHMPGLWLTTSNVMLEKDEAPMTQHAALLLLDDADTLIKHLGSDSAANAAAIAFYIRAIVPTKSLLKISKTHNILAQDMEYIASHLVYWRRARLIAPLSPRDTYIVSPNADMTALPFAITAYAQRFPTLPTLPKILSMLSGSPYPYRKLIPTAEHREPYMEILAWLMRGGWVTQLRTFAWVRVTPDIKAQVAMEMAHEERLKKAEDARKEVMSDNGSVTDSLLSDKRSSLFSAGTIRSSTPLRRTRRDNRLDPDEQMESSTILSPRIHATPHHRGSPARAVSDAGSTGTTIALHPRADSPSLLAAAAATIALRENKPHRPSPLHLNPPSPSPPPLSPPLPIPASHFAPSLVLSPQKASSLEARWLEQIGHTFDEHDHYQIPNQSPSKSLPDGARISAKELREHWPMFLRHLDGRHAVEDVAPREGMKRKKVVALFHALRERGWLVVVRHW